MLWWHFVTFRLAGMRVSIVGDCPKNSGIKPELKVTVRDADKDDVGNN